jgi:hypothetical protein
MQNVAKQIYLDIVMGYNVEISVNLLKETKITEVTTNIEDIAVKHNCQSISKVTEEDGTRKIPRCHLVMVIYFIEDDFDYLLTFIKEIKMYKKGYIECVYDNKLLYASSYYLTNIAKDKSRTYKQFLDTKHFTEKEERLVKEFKK